MAAALCHGSAIPAHGRDSKGRYIAKGRTVTGFANVEDDHADNAVWSCGMLPRDKHVMPWRIEDELNALGADVVQGGLWRSIAVHDGNLVIWQQNFSGQETARLAIEALGRSSGGDDEDQHPGRRQCRHGPGPRAAARRPR